MYKARVQMKIEGLVTSSKNLWKWNAAWIEWSIIGMLDRHASVLEPYSLTARGSRSVLLCLMYLSKLPSEDRRLFCNRYRR